MPTESCSLSVEHFVLKSLLGVPALLQLVLLGLELFRVKILHLIIPNNWWSRCQFSFQLGLICCYVVISHLRKAVNLQQVWNLYSFLNMTTTSQVIKYVQNWRKETSCSLLIVGHYADMLFWNKCHVDNKMSVITAYLTAQTVYQRKSKHGVIKTSFHKVKQSTARYSSKCVFTWCHHLRN